MDVVNYNREAWDRQVDEGNPWTVGASPEEIQAARAGKVAVLLTPTKFVPAGWLGELQGADVLGLASGGGQQGPVFAAAGARVTIFDNSPKQLARDREVAARESLELRTEQGDMADLSPFADASFDMIFHPVSNLFAPAVRPVWREAFRVLRPGGRLLAGFVNPPMYIFDFEKVDNEGVLEVRYKLPYNDVDHLDPAILQQRMAEGIPLEYSHSLEDQIGGQCDAGFYITGLFEDTFDPQDGDVISQYIPTFIATLAMKPG